MSVTRRLTHTQNAKASSLFLRNKPILQQMWEGTGPRAARAKWK